MISSKVFSASTTAPVASVLALTTFLVGSATAAVSEEPVTSADQIEEVVVTAERRAESLQDVPFAITALSGSALAEQQIGDSRGLSFSAPNLFVGQQTANSSAGLIYLRG